jgi:hypothetical protein
MKTFARLVAMALLILPCVAFGQDSDMDDDDADAGDEYARVGGYWGIGGAHVFSNYGYELTGGLLAGRKAVVEDAPALNARLGYRAHPNLAFDLVFDWITAHQVEGPLNGFRIGDIENYMLTGNVKVLPLTGRIQPFAIAGIGALLTRREIGNVRHIFIPVATRLGAGVDIYINPSFAVSLEGAYSLTLTYPYDTRFAIVGGNIQYHW